MAHWKLGRGSKGGWDPLQAWPSVPPGRHQSEFVKAEGANWKAFAGCACAHGRVLTSSLASAGLTGARLSAPSHGPKGIVPRRQHWHCGAEAAQGHPPPSFPGPHWLPRNPHRQTVPFPQRPLVCPLPRVPLTGVCRRHKAGRLLSWDSAAAARQTLALGCTLPPIKV